MKRREFFKFPALTALLIPAQAEAQPEHVHEPTDVEFGNTTFKIRTCKTCGLAYHHVPEDRAKTKTTNFGHTPVGDRFETQAPE